MTLPCPVAACDRVMPGNLRVCRACTARVLRDLADVPDLAANLGIAYARLARIGEPGACHPEPPDPAENEIALTIRKAPLPWDPRAREAADVLKSALVGWKRILSEGAPLVYGPMCPDCEHLSCEWADLGRKVPDTLAGLSQWLIRHRVRLLRHQAAPEAVDEICDAVRQARRAMDRPPDRIYAGPCGKCGQDLLARLGVSRVSCRTCVDADGDPVNYDIASRQDWMRREVEDLVGTSSWVAAVATGLGVKVSPALIRLWAKRRKLTPRRFAPPLTSGGEPRALYRVGDVLEAAHGNVSRSR